MGIKNKFDSFIARLSKNSIKMNAFIFAIFWIIYIVASFYLTLSFGMGGWSVIVTFPLTSLFYIVICLSVLAGLAIYCFKARTFKIDFFPQIFIWLLFVPQVIYVLVNPFRDCGDYDCPFAPNMLAAMLDSRWVLYDVVVWVSLIAAALSIIVYVAGVKILSKRIFDLNRVLPAANQSKSLWARIRSASLLLAVFLPIFAIVLIFWAANSPLIRFYYQFCRIGKIEDVCSWPEQQCWALFDGQKRKACYRMKIINEAVEKRDELICEKIVNEKLDDCLSRIGRAGNLSVCDSSDGCYSLVAESKNDPVICGSIKDKGIKCACYSNIGKNKTDETLCDGCLGEAVCGECVNEDCYVDIAQKKGFPSICGMIQKIDSRDFCYDRLAWFKNDASICEAITGSKKKDDCYYWIADRKKNASVCAAISDQSTKNKCYRDAGEK